jgi:cellobiose epimerase
MQADTVKHFAQSVQLELDQNLIPFWLRYAADYDRGGFIGAMSNELVADPDADKGLILNARLLWTFSAAYQYSGDLRLRSLAERAYAYLEHCFWDRQYGGMIWRVNAAGESVDHQKKIYGQAFTLYAWTEYFRAFQVQSALEHAIALFRAIEQYSLDDEYGGYIEVCQQDWSVAEAARLSPKDMAAKKSMNNHLHVLEAYTNLYRAWPNDQLRQQLLGLIELFEQRIFNQRNGHFDHFFNETWEAQSHSYTFGHDIEGSWLLWEAAQALGNQDVTHSVRDMVLGLARVTLTQGVDQDGGLSYEGQAGQIVDHNREWWPQAEALVGFLNAFELSGDRTFFLAAQAVWRFIQEFVVDREHGEWFWRVDSDGRPDPSEPKVSEWKSPYHNVRACLEAIRRLEKLSHDSI